MNRRALYAIVLVFYALALGFVTLTPVPNSPSAPPSWIPFTQIWHLLMSPQESIYSGIPQIVGNIALFVPLGWLLPIIWKGLRSVYRIAAVGAISASSIELYQLVILTGRSAAIDDVLLNTAGALVGAAMFFAARSA